VLILHRVSAAVAMERNGQWMQQRSSARFFFFF
jgi:hypothetical protein